MSVKRRLWWMPLAAAMGAGFLRLLGATWRIDRSGMRESDEAIAAGRPTIFALWHARLLPLIYTHRGRGVGVLVSRHHDGEIIARIIEKLGYVAARGSSTRGGDEGMREMLAHAAGGDCLAVTPDGPRGPAERVKAGVAYLASRTGMPITPVAAAASRAHRFQSWDRFLLPLPFSRVVVECGEPIAVPPQLELEALEPWRERIERAIGEASAAAVRRAGERP